MSESVTTVPDRHGRSAAAVPRAPALALDWPAIEARARTVAGWFIPFAIVLYLAFQNGGYDVSVRGEVGIAIWWLLLLGTAAGLIGFSRVRGAAWILVGSLALLALWTALGIAWSESAERSMIELARVITLLGILILGLLLQGREGLRRTIGGVGAAIAIVGGLALLSRLQPSWIPAGELQELPGGGNVTRLNYPLNYWNGLAALMAMGIPLLLTLALRSRSLLGQALAGASVPVLATAAFYTFSRGGAIAAGIAVVVLLAIYPRRISAIPTLLVCGIGSAILIAAASQRDALENGILGAQATEQGDEMLAAVVIVFVGVAFLQAAIGLARRYSLVPEVEVPRKPARGLAIAGAAILLVIAVAAGAPERLDREWEEFKTPAAAPTVGTARFESSVGQGRYQVWESAVEASETAPLIGIGPGTFEFWWADHGTLPAFLRDAHSLYLETLAELGLIGLALVVFFVGGVLVVGLRRAREASEEKRALLAGAVGACAAFAFAAGVDWIWELTVLPAAFCLLAAAIAGPAVIRVPTGRGAGSESRRERRRRARVKARQARALRWGTVALAAGALVAIALPYAGANLVSASQDAVPEGNAEALDEAGGAEGAAGYAATPTLQEALVLERSGNLDGAARAARESTRHEPTNWRTWMVLSRIEARRGNTAASVDAYRRARSLNNRSPLFFR